MNRNPDMPSPWLTIIGIGDNGLDSLTPVARALLEQAQTVIAPDRVLSELELREDTETLSWSGKFHDAVEDLLQRRGEPITVLATGDPMHFGVGTTMSRRLPAHEIRIVPSPSAFSLAAARLGWALQDVTCMSMHGRAVARLRAFLAPDNRILALTSNAGTVAEAAKLMVDQGYGGSKLTVLEHMGGGRERVVRFEAREAVPGDIADFNTLAIECVAGDGTLPSSSAAGLPNDAFSHDGQITKREVRAATIGALMPYPNAMLWDIGAGCGSVAIEWMRSARNARAIAIEKNNDRIAMIADNALTLGVPSLEIIIGEAPAELKSLEPPDAVFIGGGIGDDRVFDAAWKALRPGGRLVANAVTLEGEAKILALRQEWGGELARISVAHAEPVGSFHGWRPAMPVTMWSITKETGQ